jgi:hypothetical protein
MSDRNLEPVPPAVGSSLDAAAGSPGGSGRIADVTFRTPPNWTAVGFLAALGLLHLWMATHAMYLGRWEAFLSLGLGTAMLIGAVVSWLVGVEMTICRRERRIRLRTGYRRISVDRYIPFRNVHGIRLTILSDRSPLANRIEVLCDNEDLDCPPTLIPRQEALFLALAMNVRLIKVYGSGVSTDARERLDSMSA